MKDKIIHQGAEAKIYLNPKKNKITKKRIKKNYRIKKLDEKIREKRTRSETKILKKASKLIPIPGNIKKSEKNKIIEMDFLQGKKLSENLDNFPLKKQKETLKKIGKNIAKIHNKGLIHGDLTTSNMILQKDRAYLIDFGLGFHSRRYEDKAVDIYVLEKALEAKHFKNWKVLFESFKKSYLKQGQPHSKKVLKRLKKVEKRGRYKH